MNRHCDIVLFLDINNYKAIVYKADAQQFYLKEKYRPAVLLWGEGLDDVPSIIAAIQKTLEALIVIKENAVLGVSEQEEEEDMSYVVEEIMRNPFDIGIEDFINLKNTRNALARLSHLYYKYDRVIDKELSAFIKASEKYFINKKQRLLKKK